MSTASNNCDVFVGQYVQSVANGVSLKHYDVFIGGRVFGVKDNRVVSRDNETEAKFKSSCTIILERKYKLPPDVTVQDLHTAMEAYCVEWVKDHPDFELQTDHCFKFAKDFIEKFFDEQLTIQTNEVGFRQVAVGIGMMVLALALLLYEPELMSGFSKPDSSSSF